ncbi:MAG: ABC transporter permease [Oscillospiraceae bacterium]|nr:ABC transporter permease [Oscillospiraceae bacterium]
MRVLLIAFRLIWKRKLTNITIVVQIILSIIMLAQLFVFVSDHRSSVRAVSELPVSDTIVVSVFEYYTMEQAARQILATPEVESVGKIYTGTFFYNNVSINLAIYNDAIIKHYFPNLTSGNWLSDNPSVDNNAIPVVVSFDMGLRTGDTVHMSLPNGDAYQVTVVGVLKEPTQYLYPSGSASPEYFSARVIISPESVVIMRDTDLSDTSVFEPALGQPAARNLFVFINGDANAADVEAVTDAWRKYGETTPMTSLIANYVKDTNSLIGGASLMFIVFLSLAATSVLSSYLTQSMRNRRLFTVFYLLGMEWRKGVAIEICRMLILIIITMSLCLIAGASGLLMLQWMTLRSAYTFYGIVLLYITVTFAAIGVRFLVRLVREDISAALKELQQSE